MEYQFSVELRSNEYVTEGLCDGISIRKHRAADLEEIGAFRAQEDWSKMIEPVKDYKGGLGPTHSFMAVSLPECLPERFEVVCYANEFAFLHDDETEFSGKTISDAKNDALLEGFRAGADIEQIDAAASGKRQIQAKILTKMLQIDRPRAMVAMKAWATFVQQGSGREHHTAFATLEEYLPYRCIDAGHMFWHALVTFGCALTIPEDEEETCKHLVLSAVIAASLTNDLFSYDKELEAAEKAGLPFVTNALYYLMTEHSITLEEAKSRCRARIKKEVATYVQIVKTVKHRSDLSRDTKKYIEIIQYSVSGNVVWSLQCPRYNNGVQYNEQQRLRMRHGVDRFPSTYKLPPMPWTSEEPLSLGTCRSSSSSDASGDTLDDVTSFSDSSFTIVHEAHEGSSWNRMDIAKCRPLPRLCHTVAMEPILYIQSLPSKGIRDMAINALNFWLKVPKESEVTIKSVIEMLHTSSIMLDDIQDGSQLRRGHSSTHVVFGEAQTINAATYQFIEAISVIRKLNNSHCLDIFVDEVRGLFIGQSHDLLWIWEQQCPSVQEYLQMIDGKTGGLFRLLARLMAAKSRHYGSNELELLSRLLGRYFQIRDDYKNLVSDEYTSQKGICEDLDEGKYSLPLIHALNHSTKTHTIRGLLSRRRVTGSLTQEQKRLVLSLMQEAGSLDFTLVLLRMLYKELEAEINRLGNLFGQANLEMLLMLEMLKV